MGGKQEIGVARSDRRGHNLAELRGSPVAAGSSPLSWAGGRSLTQPHRPSRSRSVMKCLMLAGVPTRSRSCLSEQVSPGDEAEVAPECGDDRALEPLGRSQLGRRREVDQRERLAVLTGQPGPDDPVAAEFIPALPLGVDGVLEEVGVGRLGVGVEATVISWQSLSARYLTSTKRRLAAQLSRSGSVNAFGFSPSARQTAASCVDNVLDPPPRGMPHQRTSGASAGTSTPAAFGRTWSADFCSSQRQIVQVTAFSEVEKPNSSACSSGW